MLRIWNPSAILSRKNVIANPTNLVVCEATEINTTHIAVVAGKLVYKWKPNDNNTANKPKVRFTVKGLYQRKDRDYKKTYASVAALMTVYLTCIVAVVYDFALH